MELLAEHTEDETFSARADDAAMSPVVIEDRPASRSRHLPVIALGTSLALASVPFVVGFSRSSGSTPVLWWVLFAVAFALAEHVAVHIPLRRSAHSLPIDELPFVIGLFALGPMPLFTARLTGAAVGLLADRGTSHGRRAFGLAQYALSTAAGIWLFGVIADGASAVEPLAWVAGSAAALCAGLVGLVAVLGAVTITEGLPDRVAIGHSFASSVGVTTANTSVGLIAVFIASVDPWALLLLIPVVALSLLGYRAYIAAHHHRMQLEFVTRLLREIASTKTGEEALAVLLQMTAAELRATSATSMLLAADDESPSWRVTSIHDSVAITAMSAEETDTLRRAFGSSAQVSASVVSGFAPASTSLLARLDGDHGVVGILAVGDRIDAAGPFTTTDQLLLEAVASQAGAIVERITVERTLAHSAARERRLSFEANHDPLTNLANRRMLVNELQALATAAAPCALMIIDLDHFKPVNDEYGHTIGDEVLRRVAGRLEREALDGDVVARLGGDEFAILRRGAVDAEQWAFAGRQLSRTLGEPMHTSVGSLTVGASVGTAVSDDALTGPRLLSRADEAMYRVKHDGRGPRRG
jgi:diguanylate cyclase (GGDEF)-like protein